MKIFFFKLRFLFFGLHNKLRDILLGLLNNRLSLTVSWIWTFLNKYVSGGYNEYLHVVGGLGRAFQAIAKFLKASKCCREALVILLMLFPSWGRQVRQCRMLEFRKMGSKKCSHCFNV